MAETTETASTKPASDADVTPSEGGGAATDTPVPATDRSSDADAFAAEREQLLARARDEQARADKLLKERDDLLAAAKSKPSTDQPSGMTAEDVRAEIIRAQQIGTEAAALRADERFSYADKSILADPAKFSSVESLRAAVEQSHNERKAFLDSVGVVPKSDAEAQLAELREKYGEPASPPDGGGAQPTGEPTSAQIAAMSFAERDAYDAEHGAGTIQRLIDKQMRSV